MRLNQVTLGCTDYAASVAFYAALGLRQIVDAPPRYARFETPAGETFSIHHADRIGPMSTVVYFEIDDLDAAVAALEAAGIAFDQPPRERSVTVMIDPGFGNDECAHGSIPYLLAMVSATIQSSSSSMSIVSNGSSQRTPAVLSGKNVWWLSKADVRAK